MTMQAGTEVHDRSVSNEELANTGAAIVALLQRVPELAPLLAAAGVWLQRLASATEAASLAAPQAGSTLQQVDADGSSQRASTMTEHDQPPAPVSPSVAAPLAVPVPPVVTEPATEGQLAQLMSKFSGPAVAPRVAAPAASTASASSTAAAAVPRDPDAPLDRIRRNVALQQAAIDWSVSRDRLGYAAVKAQYQHLRTRGEQEQVFMWALDRGIEGMEVSELEEIKGWYRTLGQALDAFRDDQHGLAGSETAFEFLAQVMGQVRAALKPLASLGLHDSGLEELRGWLGSNAARFNLDGQGLKQLISREFKGGIAEASDVLRGLQKQAQVRVERQKRQRKAGNKFLYDLKQFLANPGESATHVAGMCAALDHMHAAGASSDERGFVVRVDQALGQSALPNDVLLRADGQDLALALARLHEDAGDDDAASGADHDQPHIVRVREILKGKRVVMIGGDERPNRRLAIERAFELDELRWIATRPHERHDNIEPAIERADTDVVLLLIRWSSHSYGELRETCDRLDKPLVRMPGGYSPSAIAHEFIQQAGRRFGMEALG